MVFSSLYIAASEGHTDIVGYLISKDANIDIRCEGSDDATPLIIASVYDYPSVVELLVKNNADIELKDDEGRTALFNAAIYENMKIVGILLNHDAKRDIVDNFGENLNDLLDKI